MKISLPEAVLDAYEVAGGLFVPLQRQEKPGRRLSRKGLRYVVEVKAAPRSKDPVTALFGILRGRLNDAVDIQKAMRQEWND